MADMTLQNVSLALLLISVLSIAYVGAYLRARQIRRNVRATIRHEESFSKRIGEME